MQGSLSVRSLQNAENIIFGKRIQIDIGNTGAIDRCIGYDGQILPRYAVFTHSDPAHAKAVEQTPQAISERLPATAAPTRSSSSGTNSAMRL